MAHTVLNNCFVNFIAKRATLLNAKCVQYTLCNGHKHYNPKFKKHRSLKNQLLPMYTDKAELPAHGPNSINYKFRLHGRYWNEPRTVASHTYTLIDGYDPLKDEEKSWLNPEGLIERFRKRRKDKKAIRDIQSYDEHFEIQDFLEECEGLYIKANESIAEKDEDKMLDYLTPPAFSLAKESSRNKRIRWKFIKSLDPPHPLRARAVIAQGGNEEAFAQITVRFHTQQSLAIYDRFGRLVLGSEILAKDVLEIVVFEKRLSHAHGNWRVHEKIPIPGGETARTPISRTRICEVVGEDVEEQGEVEKAVEESPPPQTVADTLSLKKSLAPETHIKPQ